jgi:hypothetical protein
MPRKSKISPAQRRDWLVRHEHGERQDTIARADRVNPRTVAAQIERAQLERAFEAAQQQQLVEALHKHQEDMLDLLKSIQMRIVVPSLDTNFNFGAPKLPPEQEVALSLDAGLSSQVTIIIHEGQPSEIRLAEEESRLWRVLKEHLGNKNPLWHDINEWQASLLKEVLARAALGNAIKKTVESKCGLTVLSRPKGEQPHLTPAATHLTEIEVAKRSLGEPPSDFPARLQLSEGALFDSKTSSYLTQWVAESEKVKNVLTEIVKSMIRSPEAKALSQAHPKLIDWTRKTRDQIEDYLLLHHIPGHCSMCKKLGGP